MNTLINVSVLNDECKLLLLSEPEPEPEPDLGSPGTGRSKLSLLQVEGNTVNRFP